MKLKTYTILKTHIKVHNRDDPDGRESESLRFSDKHNQEDRALSQVIK